MGAHISELQQISLKSEQKIKEGEKDQLKDELAAVKRKRSIEFERAIIALEMQLKQLNQEKNDANDKMKVVVMECERLKSDYKSRMKEAKENSDAQMRIEEKKMKHGFESKINQLQEKLTECEQLKDDYESRMKEAKKNDDAQMRLIEKKMEKDFESKINLLQEKFNITIDKFIKREMMQKE